MEKNRKRVEYLDILKTIAIFLVCFCHFIYLKNDYICAFVMLVAWSAVPIFFIVNGFLLFKKEFDLDKHIKKIRSVFFAFIVWKVIYLIIESILYNLPYNKFSISDIISYLFFFKGLENINIGHLWFINTLLILYIIFPLLKACYDTEWGKKYLLILMISCFLIFGFLNDLDMLLKWLGLDWKISNMISAGTGICGGSAIAAMAPVIEAEDKDVAYAMSATFIFDMAMIVLFPIMGRMMGLSDMAYGLWTGTAVNDTSSVVAAGYAFSEAAGDFATMVKLTRTLSIIPTVLIFSIINVRINNKNSDTNTTSHDKVKITSLFPWFILAFVFMSIINSFGLIPITVSNYMKTISKFLMVSSLAAIGMNTDFSEMKESGINPMIHGFIISALVVVVAIVVEYFMGLV